MAYTKYTWENLPNVTTPISKANLDHLETQYDEVKADLDTYAISVEISTAEILNLNVAPKTLVAAPGANKILEFVSLLLAYDWNTAAYTIGAATNLQVKYTNGAGAGASSTRAVTGFLDAVADSMFLFGKVSDDFTSLIPVDNAPLVLHLAGANVTLGDSPIHAKITYVVHNTGL